MSYRDRDLGYRRDSEPMRTAEPSLTAKRTAVARGEHRLLDAAPWVLDDSFALMLVGPEWRQIYDARAALHEERVRRDARAWVVARSRYAEDRLDERRFSQYVILGAGLDSFAWRRPDLLHALRVFEVDHPATQAWKRERIAMLALPISDHHVFAPVDFETESIGAGLEAAGFDWSEPTIFSWLGVTAYLEVHAIETMLRNVALATPASEIVLTYCPPESHLDEFSREFRRTILRVAADAGEPLKTILAPADANALVERCGLHVADHPDHDDIHQRYFATRTDGLTPHNHERLITATVPGATERTT
jgi:methyltransferase (TIGR00027 family)